jgi:hypothetical protein
MWVQGYYVYSSDSHVYWRVYRGDAKWLDNSATYKVTAGKIGVYEQGDIASGDKVSMLAQWWYSPTFIVSSPNGAWTPVYSHTFADLPWVITGRGQLANILGAESIGLVMNVTSPSTYVPNITHVESIGTFPL